MYSQQEYLQQAEGLPKESSDPKGGGILPLASQPVVEQDAELAEEADKYTKVKIYLEDRAVEISNYLEVLDEVNRCQKTMKDPQKLCQLIDQQLTLEQHIQRLQEESDDIRWQVVSRQATLTFSDSAAQRLLDIQVQIGQAIGALSALGAGLALSLLFSATRGNLWYMYAAWWMFLIGLTVTAGLGMAGSGNDDYNKRPSQAEWTARRWTLLGIVGCTLCVVGGFVSFSIAVIAYDLTSELQTHQGVISGPRPGPFSEHPVQKVFAFLILIGFEAVFIFGLVRALRPGLRLKNRKVRRGRRLWMLDPSRSARPVRAKTLADLLGENRR